MCCEAVERNLLLPATANAERTKNAFVVNGFSAWNRANDSFKKHEKSDFHIAAIIGRDNLEQPSVIQGLSAAKKLEMDNARLALKKIFETVLVFGREGLPFRGSYDKDEKFEKSKFMRILQMRALDVPELDSWLKRTSNKWVHHDSLEEISKLISHSILNEILSEVREAKYFSIMLDETSDITRLEQVSISVRYVTDQLVIHEKFMGFYETKSTSAVDLFNIVKDVLIRFLSLIHI